ncbi:MAG: heavy metal translocating P-type ATPase [Thermodesulfobacteriota bacterium]
MNTSVPCRLCGLPVKISSKHPPEDTSALFCCSGCRMVYSMLMESGMADDSVDFTQTELFKECVAAGVIPDPAGGEPPEEKDETEDETGTEFEPAPFSRGDSDHLLPLGFTISGMWCPACAWVVEKALQKADGVAAVSCNFSSDRARVRYDPVRTSPEKIFKTVEKLGYKAVPLGRETKKKTGEFVRLSVTAFLTMNVMMLSWAVYSGFFIDLSPISVRMIAWPAFAMATVVVFYGGYPIHRRAFAGIRTGRPGMEALITAGSFATYFYSVFHLFESSIHLYFDAASMLILLVLIGKMLEQSAKDRIAEGLSDFFSLVPKKVNIITDRFPNGRYVSAEQLGSGDLFRAREGEILAADGVVENGDARIDESSITGEAKPVNAAAGEKVKSGTRILSGDISVRAESVGEHSVLGRMIAIMEESLSGKTARTERFEGLLKFFVPLVILLAVCVYVFWTVIGLSSYEAFSRGVSVLVISCPCALGIAIPLALVAGVSKCGEKGILVRDFEAFEKAALLDTIVFDKTGTLTTGKLAVLDVETMNGFSKQQAWQLILALEQGCDHYIARTLRSGNDARELPLPEIQDVTFHSNGVSGTHDGRMLRLGSVGFVLSKDRRTAPGSLAENTDTRIISTVYLSADDEIVASVHLGDTIRGSVQKLVADLSKNGFSTCLVSGDAPAPTFEVASAVGIPSECARGGLLPDEKAAFISRLNESGKRTAMVGDGINDAPAMAQSDLAVAVHSGLTPGEGVAAITLMQEDPAQLTDFFHLSRTVNRKVRQNLIFALVYNITAIPIAAAGFLNPVIAAGAMLLSSLSVTCNTLLLVRKK